MEDLLLTLGPHDPDKVLARRLEEEARAAGGPAPWIVHNCGNYKRKFNLKALTEMARRRESLSSGKPGDSRR